MTTPYEAPAQNSVPPKHPWRWLRIGLLAIALIGAVLLLLAPLRRTGALAVARRIQCRNNLKQIACAVAAYTDHYGEPPPLVSHSAAGQPLHSWRTLILEFVDGQGSDIYSKIDLTKPWNHPDHAELAQSTPPLFHCPSSSRNDGLTVYQAYTQHGGRLAVRDDSELLMLGETADAAAVPWMQPKDNINWFRDALTPNTQTHHDSIVQGVSSTTDVHTISASADRETRVKLLDDPGSDR